MHKSDENPLTPPKVSLDPPQGPEPPLTSAQSALPLPGPEASPALKVLKSVKTGHERGRSLCAEVSLLPKGGWEPLRAEVTPLSSGRLGASLRRGFSSFSYSRYSLFSSNSRLFLVIPGYAHYTPWLYPPWYMPPYTPPCICFPIPCL